MAYKVVGSGEAADPNKLLVPVIDLFDASVADLPDLSQGGAPDGLVVLVVTAGHQRLAWTFYSNTGAIWTAGDTITADAQVASIGLLHAMHIPGATMPGGVYRIFPLGGTLTLFSAVYQTTPGTVLSADIVSALNGANALSASNVVASMTDVLPEVFGFWDANASAFPAAGEWNGQAILCTKSGNGKTLGLIYTWDSGTTTWVAGAVDFSWKKVASRQSASCTNLDLAVYLSGIYIVQGDGQAPVPLAQAVPLLKIPILLMGFWDASLGDLPDPTMIPDGTMLLIAKSGSGTGYSYTAGDVWWVQEGVWALKGPMLYSQMVGSLGYGNYVPYGGTAGGLYVYAGGMAEVNLQVCATSGTALSADILAALNGAATPTAGNVFATMADVSGPREILQATVTPYTVANTVSDNVFCSSEWGSSGPNAIYLPTVAGRSSGSTILVKDTLGVSETKNITVYPSASDTGVHIDGEDSYVINAAYGAVSFMVLNGQWVAF